MTGPIINETEPSPVEELAVLVLREMFADLDGFKSATRYPRLKENEVIAGHTFIRCEAAGGEPANEVQYDQDVILHAYYAEGDEAAGLRLANRATSGLAAVCGLTITDDLDDDWTINFGTVASLPTRAYDPVSGAMRYRSMVTLRITGGPPTR